MKLTSYLFCSFHHCVHRLYQVQTVGRLSAFKAGTHVVPDHPFSGISFSADDERTSPFIILYDLIGIALGLILTVYALKHVSIEIGAESFISERIYGLN
ncbi:hypothetical protein PO124_03130 [Bacillus licheniformis]|nr:hypothetical protein [Bacillus licheniformis]